MIITAIVFSCIIIGANCVLYFYALEAETRYYSLFILLLILNAILTMLLAKYAMSYILFPFANGLTKLYYHYIMNKKMLAETGRCFGIANEVI